VYQAAVWLSRVQEAYGDNLDITWRHFSLEQNAYTLRQGSEGNGDGDWKVWEQDDLTAGRSIVSQIASVAARRQGAREQDRFNLELLTARHGGEDRLPLNQKEAMVGIAEKAGLDVDRFKQDLDDPGLGATVGHDHEEAVSHGIFGTPTFLFENENVAFLKTFTPPEEDSVETFEHFMALASTKSYIGELKRPQPPWPKGSEN
jgi:predicted DsbA family dithiol-disulfide isomerase